MTLAHILAFIIGAQFGFLMMAMFFVSGRKSKRSEFVSLIEGMAEMAVATATLSTNAATCGPIKVQPGDRADFEIVITGTITVELQRKAPGSSTFVTVKKPDGSTAASYTASDSGDMNSAGIYQLLASGVSGGSAVCRLNSYQRIAGL